ncbi:LAETG motif-containing sortase-dependent surface protein [Streptomyces chattanoogensis]|uniref:LAETG motif-containing sortase-dependent surface protein n=1 Tax=Streptomyces chattanoogensis TaxID=66876 RepID=UPI000D14922C|nr:LAETG motif-containing sortase-dependent surface protein [Streptomyces chattanoogensis]
MDAKPVKFAAKPDDSVTVTLANTKKEQPTMPTTPPTSPETTSPAKPSHKPTSGTPHEDEGTPSPSVTASGNPSADESASSTAAPPEGSLAHTGADATPWLLGGAGVLLAAGGGAVIATRRRCTDDGPADS